MITPRVAFGGSRPHRVTCTRFSAARRAAKDLHRVGAGRRGHVERQPHANFQRFGCEVRDQFRQPLAHDRVVLDDVTLTLEKLVESFLR